MALSFTDAELHTLRQWFDNVQDVNPAYLQRDDFELARRLYTHLGMRVPYSITSRLTSRPLPWWPSTSSLCPG